MEEIDRHFVFGCCLYWFVRSVIEGEGKEEEGEGEGLEGDLEGGGTEGSGRCDSSSQRGHVQVSYSFFWRNICERIAGPHGSSCLVLV